LHLVGILFPHINDDARSKSHQIFTCIFPMALVNIASVWGCFYSVRSFRNSVNGEIDLNAL